MNFERVRDSYGARAEEYSEAVGSIGRVADADLGLLEAWARSTAGPLLDVGCGPGHWTHHLASLGADIEGVDPVPEFIESAKAAYPGERYRLGRAEDLGVNGGVLGGVLAWYSLIHTDPERIDEPLAEFARCVRPGGGLALGFFTGPRLEPFKHAIAEAYYWPIEDLCAQVEASGFVVMHTESREDRPERAHGAILATRAGTARE